MHKQKLFRITKKIVVSVIIFMCLLQTLSYGLTQEEAGASLAQFCINFYNEHAKQVIYDSTDRRDITYKNGTYDGTYYRFDCVGWVSYAVHWGLGLGNDTFTYFAVPPGGSTINGRYGRNNPMFANGFEQVYGDMTNEKYTVDNIQDKVKPGDILFKHYNPRRRRKACFNLCWRSKWSTISYTYGRNTFILK